MRSILACTFTLGLVVAGGCGPSNEETNPQSASAGMVANASSNTSASVSTGSGAGGSQGGAGPGGSSSSTGGASGGIKTVFVIVMENKAWCEVDANPDAPYINNTLLPAGAFAENYKAPQGGGLHPSLPNYIWMEAGDTLGVSDDNDPSSNHQSTTEHLVTYLENIGVTWKSYQEDIPGTQCPLTSVGEYRPKHNPMVYFDDVTGTNDPNSQKCITHVRPLPELETDLQNGTAAQYNFITPNMCNDMHDTCPPLNNRIAQGDAWLQEWIPKIQGSSQYNDGGVIIVTFDESESTIPTGNFCCILGDCPIGLIALSPLAKAGFVDSAAYDHSALLASLQEIFGSTPKLRNAATAPNLASLFTSFP